MGGADSAGVYRLVVQLARHLAISKRHAKLAEDKKKGGEPFGSTRPAPFRGGTQGRYAAKRSRQ
jgi:hypothetical protein